MRNIFVTQRVTEVKEYEEKRDSLDQRWAKLMFQAGLLPILIPNNVPLARKMYLEIPFHGLLLTGGNDLVKYGGKSPERDEVERFLLKQALAKGIPCLGVCRGMQVIQDYFGITLEKIDNHIAQRHQVFLKGDSFLSDLMKDGESVNSFHAFASKHTSINAPEHEYLSVAAYSPDLVVEAVEHRSLPVRAIMWHPERPISQNGLALIKKAFDPH